MPVRWGYKSLVSAGPMCVPPVGLGTKKYQIGNIILERDFMAFTLEGHVNTLKYILKY